MKLKLSLLLITLLFTSCVTTNYARQAQEAYQAGRFNQSITLYRSIKNIESNRRLSYNLAISYGATGQYGESIQLLENLSKKLKKNLLVKRSLAYYYGQNGDDNKAIALYNELIAFNPMDSVAVRGKATILQKQGKTAQALQELSHFYTLVADSEVEAMINELRKSKN